ncbi:MAG TPA: zf-HC2 domain-containing protein [Armatimonadota bacterium]|jgi:hypothetical protein
MFHETHNLAGYLEGALEPQVASRVERHLESCGRCRSALADMRVAKRLLSATGETIKPIHYDPELWSRVHAQIAAPPRQAPIRPRWALAGGGLALTAAAICLAIVMNLPRPGEHPGANPAHPGVHYAQKGPAKIAQAPPRSHSETGRSATPPVRGGAPEPLRPPNPRITPESGEAAPAGPPMPTPAVVPTPAPAVTKEHTLVANADTGRANVPFGAAGNAHGEVSSLAGSETKLRNRATFASKNAMKLDNQNAPSTTAQVAPPPVAEAFPADKGSSRDGFVSPVAAPTGGRSNDGPEIVAAEAPPPPSTLGLSGHVNDRALTLKARAAQPLTSYQAGIPRVGTITARTGVSTVEAHRLYADADQAFRAGKDETASTFYAEAIKSGLDSVERRTSETRLGDLAMKSNDAITAVKWYRAACAQFKDAETLTKLGDALEKSGDAKGAVAAYQQALTISPAMPAAKEGLKRVKAN